MRKRFFTCLFGLAAIATGMQAQVAINATNFPDENFRNFLLAQDYGQDGVLTAAEIAEVKEMYPADSGIKDLTGIDYFTEVETLVLNNNSLTTLDLSQNTKLNWLGVTGNP